jgi:hypothetical protein
MTTKQEGDWAALYDALQEVLSRHGAEDPYGDADYWLVDDNWGGEEHKVSISKMSFLTQAVVDDIQELLRKNYPKWAVLLALDIAKNGHRVQDQGIEVRADRIVNELNKQQLRDIFGTEFKLQGG